MALIVLNVFPHPTQFTETFALAKSLRKLGHDVHYASDQLVYKDMVLSNGFPFYQIKHDKKFRHPLDLVFNVISLFIRINFIEEYLDLFRYLRSVRNAATDKTLFDKMVSELNPDLVLIDHDLPFNALQLTRYNFPCALLRTRPPREMSDAVFPVTHHSFFSRKVKTYKVKMLWQNYFFLRSIRRIVHWLQGFGTEQYYLAHEVRNRWKDHRMIIDAKGNFYFRDTRVPELVMYPIDFAFNTPLESHQRYIGSWERSERKNGYDFVFTSKLNELIRGKHMPLVVYDLSPRTDRHVRVCKKFVQRLLHSFSGLPYQLIVAVGDQIEPESFRSVGGNTHVYHSIPFHEVVEYADLMIIDGDIHRLTNCVMHEVPALIYPLPDNWEHTGNSTRAMYHGIGLRGNLESETVSGIIEKVTRLLTSPEFKINASRLKEKILDRESDVSLPDVIQRLLAQRNDFETVPGK